MNKSLVVKMIEFKKDDEHLSEQQVCEPTFYDDGTAEIKIELVGDRSVYARVNVAELVRLAMTTGIEEAPEKE